MVCDDVGDGTRSQAQAVGGTSTEFDWTTERAPDRTGKKPYAHLLTLSVGMLCDLESTHRIVESVEGVVWSKHCQGRREVPLP